VHTPEEVFAAGGRIDGERVLVYDTDGYFTAVAMAEMLIAAGKQVTVVTPFANFAMYMFFTGEGFRVNRDLRAEGATIVPGHLVNEIGSGSVRGQGIWAPDPVEWDADAVVLVTQREPCDAVFRQVSADPERLAAEEIEAVHRIGDCLAPRLIAENIFDGHRLAREIDSEDPSEPLPFIRELPTVTRSPQVAAPPG
jgi:dimethylamine/trimethylamine dehydrogenase